MLNWASNISSNPLIVFGKPTIINTRISEDLILEKLANGDTINDLINAYPTITKEDITACLLFAADSIKNEIIYFKAS